MNSSVTVVTTDKARYPSLIRDCARRCAGKWQRPIREELHQLAAEVERQDAEIAALHLRNNYGFVEVFAFFLSVESGTTLHPLAAELVAGPSPARALAVARAAEELTPESTRPADLACYFTVLTRRIGGAA